MTEKSATFQRADGKFYLTAVDETSELEWFELRLPIKNVDGTTTTHALVYGVPHHLNLRENYAHGQICRWIKAERPDYSTEISKLKVDARVVVNRDAFEMMHNDGQLRNGICFLYGPLVRFYPLTMPVEENTSDIYWEAPVEEWTPITLPEDCSSASLQSTGGEKQFR